MSHEQLVRFCSPTLAGIKSGSLFSSEYSSEAEMTRSVRDLNRRLGPRGLRVLPLRKSGGRVLVYVYRPDGLERDLASDGARSILAAAGYRAQSAGGCIAELMRRLRRGGEFPHELGLFLSYPPEDVSGFIEYGGRGSKLSGLWKVYGDENAARRRFESYRRCTELYERQLAMGVPLEKLAVPARRA